MSTGYTIKELNNIEPEELLQILGLTFPPFNPYAIIDKLGIFFNERYETELMPLSGEITYADGKTTIWINPFEYKLRRNFTAAHEIGHYIKHFIPEIIKGKKDIVIREPRKDGNKSSKEKEANDFAARLLMPQSSIIKEIREMIARKSDGKINTKEAITKLAEMFQVSEPAMETRLNELKILK